MADYYSLWPEVYLLPSATSDTVIDALKQTFSINGIPEQLVSDNGSQYRSRTFRKFMTAWNVQHTTSSPRYPRSNGLAESMVKSVKKTIKKCVRSKQDIYMGLLILRNSPLNHGSSSAQLLLNCKLQDNLPKFHLSRPLKPQRDLSQERMKSKTVKFPNQKVFNQVTKSWFKIQSQKNGHLEGQILRQVAPRLFEVKVDKKTILRRNQQQLYKVFALVSSAKVCLPEVKSSLPPSMPLIPVSPNISFRSNEFIISC